MIDELLLNINLSKAEGSKMEVSIYFFIWSVALDSISHD